MQLHVAVAGGVLQPVRHRQPGLAPLPGLPPVRAAPVRAGAGVPGLALEVPKPRPDRLVDHPVDLIQQPGPVRLPGHVTRPPRQPRILPQRGVEHGDRLAEADRQVHVQRRQPRPPGRLDPQLRLPLSRGMRLSRQQLLPDLPVPLPRLGEPRLAAKLGPVRALPLAEQQVIRLAIDPLTLPETQRLRGRPPPPARRLPLIRSLQVVIGRPRQPHVPPGVIQVIALSDRRHDRHLVTSPEGRTDHDHQMMQGCARL